MRKINIKLAIFLSIFVLMLSGCNLLEYELGNFKEGIKGRPVVIQTFDEDSNPIDKIVGKSVSIAADGEFNLKDSEGNVIEKSSVIGFTVGGKRVTHVGSSLILYEQGLENVIDEYIKNVDLYNSDRSTPFINRIVHDFQNLTTGKDKIILIRSQTGKPLATFIGNDVSYFATDIDKSTGILIDGKYLFIYRCDYTIYDLELFK